MRVFISGPMTGLPDFNYPAFRAAAKALKKAGHDPIDPSRTSNVTTLPRSYYIRAAIKGVMRAEAVATLPGWESSEGANLEVRLARELNLPVRPLEEFL